MGWTSYTYRKATHLKWTEEQAKEFAFKEFNSSGYEILKFHYHKAITIHHHNEL